MPCKFSIFYGIFEDFRHWEHNRGASTWPWGSRYAHSPWAHPLPRGPMVAPLHLFLHPHTPSSSQKNHYLAQARVSARFAAIFDLLAQSSIHKTALGDCSLVCDSSMIQLVFVLVLYSLQILVAKVTLFLSLHVKFMRSQVILMHDIGSRHLWE